MLSCKRVPRTAQLTVPFVQVCITSGFQQMAVLAVNEVTHCLRRMMDSDYISVRPVLVQPAPQHAPDTAPLTSEPLQPQVSSTRCINGTLGVLELCIS